MKRTIIMIAASIAAFALNMSFYFIAGALMH